MAQQSNPGIAIADMDYRTAHARSGSPSQTQKDGCIEQSKVPVVPKQQVPMVNTQVKLRQAFLAETSRTGSKT